MGDIAKTAGMQTQYKAEHVFHGRVAEPYIGCYCHFYLQTAACDCTTKRDTIIRDLLIHNYLVGDECRRDGNRISQASDPAIFEVKGAHIGKNPQARYPADMERGTDKCDRLVNIEYTAKAQHCYQQFVQDAHKNNDNFESVLCTFLKGSQSL
eukprot:5165648-Ditylum_brightwellii.AAC.1